MTAGEQLRARLAAEFKEHETEPDGRDLELIDQACSTVDAIADLENVIAEQGRTIKGSRGQTVIHPAVAEVRMHKLVLARLLAAVTFTTDEEKMSDEPGRPEGHRRQVGPEATRLRPAAEASRPAEGHLMSRLDEDIASVRATAELADALGLTDIFELLDVLDTYAQVQEAERGEVGYEFFGSRP